MDARTGCAAGTPVVNFAVAVNRSIPQGDGEWKDALDGFFDCELWGGQAVTLVETCRKGAEVQLSGSLRQNKFKTKGENPRTISRIVVRVDSIAEVLEVHKDAEAAVPTEEAVAPQPALEPTSPLLADAMGRDAGPA